MAKKKIYKKQCLSCLKPHSLKGDYCSVDCHIGSPIVLTTKDEFEHWGKTREHGYK